VLTAERTGLDGARLFGVRLAATLAAATVSYVAIEAPFRFRLRMPRPRLAALAAGVVAAVACLVLALPQHPAPFADLAAASPGGGPATPGADAAPAGEPGGGMLANLRVVGAVTPRDGAADAGTVVMAGDSVAWSLMPGFAFWNDDHPDRDLQVDSHIAFGCPAGGPGATRIVHEHAGWPECETWHDELDAALARSSPDLVVVVMGLADLGGRQFDGEWRVPGDRTFDRSELRRLDDLAARLDAAGAHVVWLTFPHVRVRDPEDPTRPWDDIPVNDAARVDRYNALVREAAAGHPGIRVVDLAAWVDTWPNGSFEPDIRDGVHFSFAGADRVGEWLIPQLLDELRPEGPPS
jgi:lysophospholipase L1-like esterase